MIYLELVLKSFLLSWLIVNMEPIQTYLVGSLEGLNQAWFIKKPIIYSLLGSIIKIPSCARCCGLWVGIVLSGNIYVGIATSIISFLFDRFQGNIKIKLW